MLLAAAALTAALVAVALYYQHAGIRRDARRCAAPGRMLAIDGVSLHVFSLGHGAPPVVFVSGIAASCLNWSALQREVAAHTQAVAYDRPGLGWSDLGPRGLTAARHAEMLQRLLVAGGVRTPVVLVAHSFGAYVAQLFAHGRPADVAGLVLVDPVSWEEWMTPEADRRFMLRGGVFVARVGALLAALGIVRASIGRFRRGSEGMGRAILGSFGARAVEAVSRVMGEVGKMPPETWDAIQAHWSRPRAFESMARHFASLPSSAREVRDAERGRREQWTMPLVVLGAGHVTEVQRAGQQRLAAQSTQGRYERVSEAGHWIHLDQPQLVRDTILDVVSRARDHR